MTPRPEDVALVNHAADMLVMQPVQAGYGAAQRLDTSNQLRALASRLEGEGRDGEPRGLARFRLWLEGAMRTNPSDLWERGYLDALRDVSVELNLALLAAPASSPQPTTTTEEQEP